MVIVYTDGAASGNPGPGGYGVVMLAPAHQLRKELSGGYRLTTNNRMELLAVIVALEALKKPSEVLIYSDSQYVINAVEKGWLFNWIRTNFKDKKNADLWMRYASIAKIHKVRFQWVRGHAGNIENERCDQLAVEARMQPNLPKDSVFEVEHAREKAKKAEEKRQQKLK